MPGRRSSPSGSWSGPGSRPSPRTIFRAAGLGVAPAFWVVKQVELDLPDAAIGELLRERRVRVLEALRCASPRRRDQGPHRRGGLDVIGIVRADHLDLVQTNVIGGHDRGAQSHGERGHEQR